MPVIAGFALAFSAALGSGGSPLAQVAAAPIVIPAPQSVEEYVREYFSDAPVMIDIARCESQFRQFGKDGHAIKNPASSATGTFQIMASIHADFAKNKLGYDIYSLDGNAAYARYLYDKQGTVPWNASKHCWGSSQHLAVK